MHCLSGMIFDQGQLATAMHEPQDRGSGIAANACSAMKRDLVLGLTSLGGDLSKTELRAYDISLLHEYLSMSVFVSVSNLIIISGKEGAQEARRMYPYVRQWASSADSRQALWHAGQISKIVRLMPRLLQRIQLVIAWQAAFVLVSYALLLQAFREATRMGNDTYNAVQDSKVVLLDGEFSEEITEFVNDESHRPGIRAFHIDGSAACLTFDDPQKVAHALGSSIMARCSGYGQRPSPLAAVLIELLERIASATSEIVSPAEVGVQNVQS